MALLEIFRNAALAGFGVQEKVKDFIDDLVKKGEMSKSQGARIIRELTERVEKSSDDLTKSISELITKSLERMNLPTRHDIESLNRKVRALTVRVKKLEEAAEKSEQKES
jgi:polyhydroxyalkanoate synthesis regulator phasin